MTDSASQMHWPGLQLLMAGLASYLGTTALAYRHAPPDGAVVAAEMAAPSPILASLALLALMRLWKSLPPQDAIWRHGLGLILLLSAMTSMAQVYFLFR